MNKQQEPRLRFKGFSGAWEEKKIGEILSEVRRSIYLEDSEKYQLVTVKRRNEGVVSRGYLLGKDILVKNYSQLKTNDYLISKRQIIHGANGIVPSELDNAIVSNEYLVVVSNNDVRTEFLTLVSRTPSMYRKFLLSSYGVDIEKMVFNVEDWKSREITLPSLPEQTHLSLFFRHLDRQIAESRAVLEKSRQLKKAMLAKMFPTNGEKIPKIRFKGFEGEWESRKLGEISDFAKGKGLSKSSIDSNGNTPCILYGELYTKYDCYINKVFSSTNEKIENPILTKSNDVLLPTSDVTPNGLAKACSIYFDDIVLGGDILVIRSTEMFGLFFAHYVESNPFMIIEKATGTTVFHIYEKDLRDIVLLLPSYEEQTAIGNFFRQLDETITLQSAEVERLNQLKKGLLAAMLV